MEPPSPAAANDREPTLRVSQVRVVLGCKEILAGVDLAVHACEVLGVLGPSGAGKSTLFRVIAGELALQCGSVWLHGRDVSRLPLWRRARLGLGYVPQTPSVLFDLDVRSNICTFQRALRRIWQPPEQWAELADLMPQLYVRVANLSGGERRRLELLRALMADPHVLVVDEPLTGSDPARAQLLGRLLRQSAERGAAVVLADHRIGEVLGFCDRTVLLADGTAESVTVSPVARPGLHELTAISAIRSA